MQSWRWTQDRAHWTCSTVTGRVGVVACYFWHLLGTHFHHSTLASLRCFIKYMFIFEMYLFTCTCLAVKAKQLICHLGHIKIVSTSYIAPIILIWLTPIQFFLFKLTHSAHTVLGNDCSCSEGGKMTELRESQRKYRGPEKMIRDFACKT